MSGRRGEEEPRQQVPIRGVLFDATGTLFDLAESVGTVYSRMASGEGIDLPAWRIDDAFKRISSHAPPRVFPDMPQNEIAELEMRWWHDVVRSTFLATDSTVKFPNFAAFFARLFAFYETAEAWSLRSGAREVLAELSHSGIATGVVSNFDQRIRGILQALEIAEFFKIVMIPAECAAEKPAAEIFEAALKGLELEAGAVLFVGDHPEKDRAAAERVGMRSLDPGTLDSLTDIARRI